VRGRRGAAKTVAPDAPDPALPDPLHRAALAHDGGRRLRLRVDSRTALTQLSFKVPAALLPAQTAKRRAAGFVRLYVGGTATPLRYKLWLPGRAPRRGCSPAPASRP
jgi:hypothetical protein